MSIESALVKTVTSVSDFEAFTGPELLAWFNANVSVESEKVKRFADKASAIRRCAKRFDILEIEKETESLTDEEWEAKMRADALIEIEKESKGIDADIREVKAKKEKAPRLLARIEAGEEIRLSSNSKGIANSWDVAEVKEARLKRNGVSVSVNGELKGAFKSLRVAFAELKLPDAKHIKFRGELKKEGAKTFEFDGVKYDFVVLD